MNSIEQVSHLINNLTNDNDLRQDLWVVYLTNTSCENLEERLQEIKAENLTNLKLQVKLWDFIKNPPNEQLSNIISSNFSEYERSIIFYLMIGLSVSEISNIKGISEVRIRQSIATIRYNDTWSKYGIKEKS